MTRTLPLLSPLADDPPVAEIESGGPALPLRCIAKHQKYTYETIPGYFVQSEGSKGIKFEPDLLDRTFGMIDTSPQRWENLDKGIKELNNSAPEGVEYKVFFLGRHGQGWHNYGATKYGAEAWENKWTFLLGDDEITWGPDPPLTPEGERQARAIQTAWKREVEAGAPVNPNDMKWYVSPLTRTGQTLLLSFGDLLDGVVPEVWEDWREIYGSHTCDKRSSKSYIQKRFPKFTIEDNFAEEDPYWTPDQRESDESMQIRSIRALDRIFDKDKEIYISVTGHSAIFRNTLAVLGHPVYPLYTGEMIPVVVKASRIRENGIVNGHYKTEENGVRGHEANGDL